MEFLKKFRICFAFMHFSAIFFHGIGYASQLNSNLSTNFQTAQLFNLDQFNADFSNQPEAALLKSVATLWFEAKNHDRFRGTPFIDDATNINLCFQAKSNAQTTFHVGDFIRSNPLTNDFSEQQLLDQLQPPQGGFELASISKIFTTWWVLTALKENKIPTIFRTTLSFDPKTAQLTIQGSKDPLYGTDRLVEDLKALKNKLWAKKLNIKRIAKVSMSNFIALPTYSMDHGYDVKLEAENSSRFYPSNDQTAQTVLKYISMLFPASTDIVTEFTDKLPASNSKNLNSIFSVSSSQINILKLLRLINVESSNLGADLLFDEMGGAEKFYPFMESKFPYSRDFFEGFTRDDGRHFGLDPFTPFAFYTGSGLPTWLPKNATSIADISNIYLPSADNILKRNKATCDMLFSALHQLNATTNGAPQTVLPQNGIDGGLKHIVLPHYLLAKNFTGKTGTLRNLLVLTGMMNTKFGKRSFFLSFSKKGFFEPNLNERSELQDDNSGVESSESTGSEASADHNTAAKNDESNLMTKSRYFRRLLTPKILALLNKYYQ